MSDEPTTTAPVEDQAPAASTEPTTTAEPVAATSETNGEAPIAKEDEEIAGKQATTEVTAPTGEEKTEVAAGPTDPEASTAAPASHKKGHRKSAGGVPEHKKKQLNKKKSMPSLQLDCKPGDFYWARLKGYPPWPAVICDEEMLPETLLASRPVSTARPDGTLRDDFKEGGKNVKERTWPVMFMATNEFVWLVNTGLTKLQPDECLEHPPKKMTKALQLAYQIASEDHDLAYFKGLLKDFEEEQKRLDEEKKALDAEEEERLAKKAEKEAKAVEEAAKSGGGEKKKKARKSKGGESDDVEMGDAEEAKPSKKRKKDADSDGEGKPQKTPKVTKLNAPKTPNGASTTKKSSKPKKTVSAPKVSDEETEDKVPMTEEEKFAHKKKTIYYLRHKLQKGFLSRDEAPKDEAMAEMSEFLSQLEGHKDLDSAIIKETKIHKVLKGIVKLDSIPKESEYDFKKRSHAMLDIWSKRMDGEGGEGAAPAKESAEPKTAHAAEEEKPVVAQTNGDAEMKDAAEDAAKEGAEQEEKVEEEALTKAEEIDEKIEKKEPEAPAGAVAVEKEAEAKVELDEKKDDLTEPPAAPVETTDPGNDAKDEADGEGDVSMQTAPETAT